MSLCTLGNLFTNNECLYGYQWWLWCNHVMWLSSSSMVLQLHTINTVHTLTPTLLTKPPSPHTHVCAQYKPITYVSFSHTVHTVQTWPLHCSHIVHNQHTHTHTHTHTQLTTYTCECPSLFTGQQCETSFNPCEAFPCGGGQGCVIEDNSYICEDCTILAESKCWLQKNVYMLLA